MAFETFSVWEFLNGWRKIVPSGRPSEREAALAEFQPCSWLLVAEAAGRPKSCTTAEVGCGANTVGQIGRRTIVVDKMHVVGDGFYGVMPMSCVVAGRSDSTGDRRAAWLHLCDWHSDISDRRDAAGTCCQQHGEVQCRATGDDAWQLAVRLRRRRFTRSPPSSSSSLSLSLRKFIVRVWIGWQFFWRNFDIFIYASCSGHHVVGQ